MGCGASIQPGLEVIPIDQIKAFPTLSETNHSSIADYYDVIVVGSGYGGGIASSRAARSGKSVCVLERGKEWRPGDFPEEWKGAKDETQIKIKGLETTGNKVGLYEFVVGKSVTVIKGCGLGGTSLINANVCMEADENVFLDDAWPDEFQLDFGNFKKDMERAKQMLRPEPYPKDIAKAKELSKIARTLHQGTSDIEDLGNIFKAAKAKPFDQLFYKTPINVTSHTKHVISNHVGVPQPECNGCGNCCGGCNTGAKNTVNMNYLPDAKYHGAHIFTRVKVLRINQDIKKGHWQVEYQRYHDNDVENEAQVVTCGVVILAAGSLGSTEILLRSKESGLNVSHCVGKGFSGNGDKLGVSWTNDEDSNVYALPSDYQPSDKHIPPGPCITSIVDLRRLGSDVPFTQQLVLEDVSVNTSVIDAFKVLLYVTSPFFSHDEDPSDDWEQFVDRLKGKAACKTLPILAISHDHVTSNGEHSAGEIQLDKDGVSVQWKDGGDNPNYENIEKAYKLASKALGGTYLQNPYWSNAFKTIFGEKGCVSAHPLGGCSMAESGESGVVNHKGQVFEGNTKNVLPGLYVMDGAVVPCSVGINPLLTICGIAERCMRLLADDLNWTIDYSFVENPSEIIWEKHDTVGIKVIESMEGRFVKKASGKSSNCKFTLTLKSEDLETLVERDPNHEMLADGVVECDVLSKTPMTAKGTVQMFVPDTGPDSVIGQYHMYYRLMLYPTEGKNTYCFVGDKNIKKDTAFETGFEDTTTLYYTVHLGASNEGPVVGNGVLKMPIKQLLASLKNVQVTNAKGGFRKQQKLKLMFSKMFLQNINDIYSPFSSKQMTMGLDRKRRPLNLPKYAQPRIYKVLTKDDQVNRLTRFQGGNKGPVLLLHGHGTNTISFALDTVAVNFVEYLVSNEYDVWSLDWRCASYQNPSEFPYTLDEVAKYDIPSAVDRVLKETRHQDLQVVGHCIGSVTFWMSRMAGYLDGKIRSNVSGQVALTPIPSPFNRAKAPLFRDVLMKTQIRATDVYDDDLSWIDSVANKMSKVIVDAAYSSENECKNSVCHKLTIVYGMVWEHNQLNNDTHRTFHEMFGKASWKSFDHIAKILIDEKISGYENSGLYLPGYSKTKKKRDASEEYKERMKRSDLPMLLMMGELNKIFKYPDCMKTMHKVVTEAHPDRAHLFEFWPIKKYGHLDTFIGKNAHLDVFPGVVKFLDKYCEGELVTKGEDVDGNTTDEDTRQWIENQKIASIELNNQLPNEKVVVWKKRNGSRCARYQEPQPLGPEEVRFVKITLDDSRKRDIYAISDTHMAAYFGRDTPKHLLPFLEKLTAASFEVHSFVLTGDVFEMWHIPVNQVPPTAMQMVNRLKSGEFRGVPEVVAAIRNLADNHDVMVYYLRGNHDSYMTKEACQELFGERVVFIGGILIMEIVEGNETYRIRFEHGHDWDLVNSFVLSDVEGGLLKGGHNYGYFIARLSGTTKTNFISSWTEFLTKNIRTLCEKFGFDSFAQLTTKLLSTDVMQRRLNKMLLDGASTKIHPDQKILINKEGEYVTYDELMNHKLVQKLAKRVGGDRVFDMLKHGIGDFTDCLRTFDEDVAIMGHSDIKACTTVPGLNGNIIYANTGAWHGFVKEISYIKITPPRHDIESGDGRVELNFLMRDRDTFRVD